MRCLILSATLHLLGALATPLPEILANVQNLEDFVLAKSTIPEVLPSATTVLHTPDGNLRVDVMEGRDGPKWLRARGVQYGEHPVGALRWQPPLASKKWDGVKDGTQWGDDCVQGPFLTRLSSIQSHSMSESCLYLNVWAPYQESDHATAPGRPVLFWMHGGSFTSGGTTSYSGDGMFSYRRDVLLVTVNYRLGALGFLGGQTIAANTTDGSSGNFGLQDTNLALQWVRRNIASFGGDPNRVTIVGESAGASLVETHLTAPFSNGLFHSAIMQSGAFDNYTIQLEPDAQFASFASQAGCDGAQALDCLRGLPLWDTSGDTGLMPVISNASATGSFGPCIDHVVLQESPLQSAQAGRLNKVASSIIGTTLNEGRLLMPLMMPMANGALSTRKDLAEWLQYYYPGAEEVIDTQYAQEMAAGELTPWEIATLIYTDSQYLCPTQESARWLAALGVDTFVYRLEYQPSTYEATAATLFQTLWCDDFSRCSNMTAAHIGVGHGADVSLLFNSPQLNTTDIVVAKAMIDYWQNFALRGSPDSLTPSNLPKWPAFADANTTMLLSPRPSSKSPLRQQYCDFWANTHSGLPPVVNVQPAVSVL